MTSCLLDQQGTSNCIFGLLFSMIASSTGTQQWSDLSTVVLRYDQLG